MRNTIVTAAALCLAGCATAEMDGFAEVAAKSELVNIEGVGWGRSGNFTLSPLGVAGKFRRSAGSSTVNGDKLSQGRVVFDLIGDGEFGGLQAECAHSRETFETSERVSRRATFGTSTLIGPYVMTCGFFRGADDIGGIEVREEQGGTFDGRTLRSGHADVGDAKMRLASIHAIPGIEMPSGPPMGYAMDFAGGGEAMLHSNGSTQQIALPPAGRDERTAALLSGIALALVWDPGDD